MFEGVGIAVRMCLTMCVCLCAGLRVCVCVYFNLHENMRSGKPPNSGICKICSSNLFFFFPDQKFSIKTQQYNQSAPWCWTYPDWTRNARYIFFFNDFSEMIRLLLIQQRPYFPLTRTAYVTRYLASGDAKIPTKCNIDRFFIV